jgi:heme A synthase
MENKRTMFIVAILMIIFGVVILANTVSAESEVTIYVKDRFATPLPNALVTITDDTNTVVFSDYADEAGMVIITLAEGIYTFTAEYRYSSISIEREITDPGPHTIELVIYENVFDYISAIGLFGLLIMIILFLFAIWVLVWVFKDAEARGQSGVLWLLIVLFVPLIGLIIWLIVRRGLTKKKK